MNDILTRYLRSPANITQKLLGLTTSWQQILPADPDRFDLWVSADSSNNAAITFQLPGSMHGMVTLSTAYNFVEFSADTMGELITYPIWGIALAGTPNIVATASSYTSRSKQIYERIIAAELSKFGTL